MPAPVVLSRLSWSTPDGHRLFSELDLSFAHEKTGLIGRMAQGNRRF